VSQIVIILLAMLGCGLLGCFFMWLTGPHG
jgi:hypothetical protein